MAGGFAQQRLDTTVQHYSGSGKPTDMGEGADGVPAIADGLTLKLPPIGFGIQGPARTSSTTSSGGSGSPDPAAAAVGSGAEAASAASKFGTALGAGGETAVRLQRKAAADGTGTGCGCCITKGGKKHKHMRTAKAKKIGDASTGPPLVLPLDPIVNEDVLSLPTGDRTQQKSNCRWRLAAAGCWCC